MPDYYPLIARAVSRLEKNTPEAHQDLFEQTRAILSDQLRNRQPPASDSEIMRERAALDEAIRKIESEIATESTPHAGSIGAPSKSADGKSQVRAFEQDGVVSSPARGRITFSQGQRPIIELGRAADASTFINLFGHQLLEQLIRDAAHPLAPGSLRQDARTALKWLNVANPEAVETKHHDQFARAFERYVMEGQAPSGALAPALATLSESLTKVYGTSDSLKVPLNDDIRGVFNRLLAMPDQTDTWAADRHRAAIVPKDLPEPRTLHAQNSNAGIDDKDGFEREAAERGVAVAQYNVGVRYANGRGVEKNEREAVAWFRKAAEQGYAPAQVILALSYEEGRGGLANDEREAARLYKLAADQRNSRAQLRLAYFYFEGRGGLPKDDREAVHLYKLAAHQGNAHAQVALGLLYEQGGGGLPKDDREAARLYKLAADQRNSRAQLRLAYFYFEGRGGLPKNEREALRLYKLAADQGNPFAQSELAAFYKHGRGGLAKDEREAARLFKLAADQGNAFAQFELAVFYQEGGGGLPKSDQEAVRLLKLAVDRGLPKDYPGTMRLFKLAADHGEPLAQAALTGQGSRRSQLERSPTTAPTYLVRQSELLYWSETIGCGATIKLCSNEICAVSIARSGVLVKSSRMGKFRRRSVGFFGTVLYNERNVYKAAQTAIALDDLFPDKGVPVTFCNPVLRAYANAIWKCSTAAEVGITLNELIAKAEAQAKTDKRIVDDLADMMAQGRTRPLAFYDVSLLPYSKEIILKAIEREILREPSDARIELLKVGALFLTTFQEGIGSKPLFELGLDLDELRRRAPDPREQLRIVAESAEVERVRHFQSLKEIGTDQIIARLKAAVRSRNARFLALLGNAP